MTRKLLFDPDLVIPRGPSSTTLAFWVELIEWIELSPGAKMGRSTYTYFINNFGKWLAESGLQPNGANSLIRRVAAAVFEIHNDARTLADCRHVCEAYSVEDRRQLLIDDLAGLARSGIDIVTIEHSWYPLCGVGKSCGRCKKSDIRLAVERGKSASRRLGENIDGEVAQLPIDTCTACLQDSHGNHYAEDALSGLWWTRDNDGHGGVVFKTFIKAGTLLRFEADRDGKGNKIESKHKGPQRATIHIRRLSRCSNPSRHGSTRS